MSQKLVLASGFGAFEGVDVNPSALVLAALREAPPAGIEVRGAQLPVSFERSRQVWERGIADLDRQPDLLLAMGVMPEHGFRLERRARAVLPNRERLDVDGCTASGSVASCDEDLSTGLDLAQAVAALSAKGWSSVRVSEDAGGYVCECIYHHVLTRARELGCPGLFLHVPPMAAETLQRQAEFARDLCAVLLSD